MQNIAQQRYGYHHLETDDEVLKRLRDDGLTVKMRARSASETLDKWLEDHGQTRKLIYVS